MALASAAKAQSDQATFIFTQQRAVSYLEVQPPFSSFLPNTIRRDTFTSSASRLISIISRFRMGVYPLHPLRNTLTNTLKSVIWQRKSCLSEPLSFCGNISSFYLCVCVKTACNLRNYQQDLGTRVRQLYLWGGKLISVGNTVLLEF